MSAEQRALTPQEQILSISGLYQWNRFEELLLAHSTDEHSARAFLTNLQQQIVTAGVARDDVAFTLEIIPFDDPLVVKQQGFGIATVQLSVVDGKLKPSKAFVFKLTQLGDGVLKLDSETVQEQDVLVPQPSNLFVQARAEKDAPTALGAAFEAQAKSAANDTPVLQEVKPIVGWLKTVAERHQFSFVQLEETLAAAFADEDTYGNFMRAITKELAGEEFILDAMHPSFSMLLGLEEDAINYKFLDIVYRSQRLNVSPSKHVLRIHCTLDWMSDAITPIITDFVVRDGLEYDADFIDHARQAKQFEFQRIASSLPMEMPLVDKLAAFFNDPVVADVVRANLVQKGLYELIDRVTFRMTGAPLTDRLQEVKITFFNKGVVEVASMSSVWRYSDEKKGYIVDSFDPDVKLADKITKVARADAIEHAGGARTIDLAHFNLGSGMKTLPDHKAEEQLPPEASTPVILHGDFDISLTFKDKCMPLGLLESLDHRYRTEFSAKYWSLHNLLDNSAKLGSQDELTLNLKGVLFEGDLTMRPKLVMTLSVRRDYLLGDSFKAEVKYQFA
jgi:hypothetical protein